MTWSLAKILNSQFCTIFRKSFLNFSIFSSLFYTFRMRRGSLKRVIAYLTLLFLPLSLRCCITSKQFQNLFKRATGKSFHTSSYQMHSFLSNSYPVFEIRITIDYVLVASLKLFFSMLLPSVFLNSNMFSWKVLRLS